MHILHIYTHIYLLVIEFQSFLVAYGLGSSVAYILAADEDDDEGAE